MKTFIVQYAKSGLVIISPCIFPRQSLALALVLRAQTLLTSLQVGYRTYNNVY